MKEQELRAILSANIKRGRAYSKISQLELANKLDISTNFLSDIERCKTWVSPLTLVKLADALKIEPYELLKPNIEVSPTEKGILEKFSDDAVVAVNKALASIRHSYLDD
jgi:transcriptional regulator with XRE-family HTH domain